jgi:hypothetical protein
MGKLDINILTQSLQGQYAKTSGFISVSLLKAIEMWNSGGSR